ncbi:MAG: OmpA family protein [Prevotella sp.]|nr:OmpA family protein [Prevotella sp.]MBR4650996.1 OmpA family protein [Prevotella sp.]
MKNLKIVAVLLALCVCLSGCNTWNNMSKTGQGAIIGTGGGAAVGSIIGAIAGNTAIGAVIGGAVGAGTGAIIGNRMDKVKKQAQQQLPNATVETVKDANNLDAVKVTFNSGILFATNKADLSQSSKNELNNLANIMKENKDISVDIKGYTDSTGSDAINNPLSVNRAQSVANYLTQNGVQYAQMKNVNGYGSSNPVASNETAEGRQQNRRVEVYLYASQEMINKAQQQAQ